MHNALELLPNAREQKHDRLGQNSAPRASGRFSNPLPTWELRHRETVKPTWFCPRVSRKWGKIQPLAKSRKSQRPYWPPAIATTHYTMLSKNHQDAQKGRDLE